MSTEGLPDFLGGEPEPESAPEAVAPAPAPEPAAPEAPAEGPARGPDGKFAPAAPPVAEAAPAAPVIPEPAPHHVPLATFLDQRDKLSAAEKEARELRAWRQQQEAAAARQPPPDRYDDPDGYEAHRQSVIQGELYAQRLDTSRAIAEMKHGPDVTKAALDWGVQRCDQDPYFNEKLRNSRDPVGMAVEEWKREQLVSRLSPNDIDAFQQWRAAQAGAAPAGQATAAPAAPPQAPAAPRASLAGGPSAGANADAIPLDGEQTFQRMFG